MKLFQCTTLYSSYLRQLDRLAADCQSFAERQQVFRKDRHGAPHFLKPILDGAPQAFQANMNDLIHQQMWAVENGLPASTAPETILLAQIEHHRTEVFYSMDPVALPSAFVNKLPGCVKRTIAWRGAPTKGADFTAYNLVLSNFPSMLETYRQSGNRVALFGPAHDPVMDEYAKNSQRSTDLLFIGSFTRNHKVRAELLKTMARQSGEFTIKLHLESSRLTKWVDKSPLRWVPWQPYTTPAAVRDIAEGPIFGLDAYKALGNAKVVLNCSIDTAGEYRGNIRCFESMGCGCVMLSDEGQYPDGMRAGDNFITYRDPMDAVVRLRQLINEPELIQKIGTQANQDVARRYSKERQFQDFSELAA
jgi:Glycosyl transferases group 1